MPNIGEIQKANVIGRIGSVKWIWHACVDCGKERWVRLVMNSPKSIHCRRCGGKVNCKNGKGEKSHSWKGGNYIDAGGYRLIWLLPNDFFFSMANKQGYVPEHRLVMAKHLGRNLHRWEIVHHKNGIKDDNRIENLQLVSDDRHTQITILENRIKRLEFKVEEQDKFIKLLQWQIKEQNKIREV